MNKIVHILALHSHGGRFWVLPEEFVSAERHEKSSAWQTTYESSRGDLQRRRIASLFRQARRELEEVRREGWRESRQRRAAAPLAVPEPIQEGTEEAGEETWGLALKLALAKGPAITVAPAALFARLPAAARASPSA